jgi:2-haloacid dehalogenase
MTTFKPKYITFDCYGTLTRFRMRDMAREMFADRVSEEHMEQFIKDFAAYRFDEVLGAWKPYSEVLMNAVERSCKKWKIEFRPEDGRAVYEAVPTWGPHADVAEPLKVVAKEIPLVILSNASDDQIHHNVALLEAPFAHVYTAQQAQAYKPRLQAWEYMFDQLGCGPEEMMHVSSSFRYDHMSARDLGYGARVFVNRGHDPSLTEHYATHEITDIGGLPGILGL